jgi:ferredoxin
LTAVSEAQFLASAGASLWNEEAARCLACGACSAVCPTCSCFEVLDDAGLDDTVIRRRVWDNCFFPDHARVAGGYDFRAGRAARLRFRFEHKRVGFGAMRGMASCVGCGRCRLACPVGIDLEPIAAKLLAEAP